ncbi:MAG: penicillin-binding protein 2 [Desulfobacteraceae bacterium]|jgi:cell division protein FtsI (penicillin-binding protein 3)
MDVRKRRARRAAFVGAFFMLWLVGIGVRAGYLQIYRGQWLQDQAEGQVKKELTIHGKRGTIYDARHQAMAVSIETPSIAAYPGSIVNKTKAASLLAKTLGLKPDLVRRKLAGGKHFVWLKRQASPKEAEAVKALKLKGVDFLPEHQRFYPNTTLAAQVLGFTGIDGHGLEGLEFYYDRQLNGGEHKVTILKDALGRGFDADQLSGLQQAGNNLVLTLDRHIQYIAEQALSEAVTKYKAKSGLAIVMNPKTGALLAIAHDPVFNLNTYRKYDRTVWRNRSITDPFEPGSTMKIFSVAAALETGTMDSGTIFYCENGTYPVGGHTVHDTKSYGWLSLQQIVKYSSNIGAVKLVEKMGNRTLFDSLQKFGFGRRTRIDSPGESTGSLSHYKRWTSVDAGAIAFGQGVSVTGLQLITAVAALANDGLAMQPHIVQAITDPNGKLIWNVEPKSTGQVVSVKTARTVRRIMRTVITPGGTGINAGLDGYDVCGKTGTAQKIDEDGGYASNKYVSSFVGFAPAQQPALTVLVIVDEPQGSYYGGVVAAPVFKKIIKETLGYLNIVPNNSLQRL